MLLGALNPASVQVEEAERIARPVGSRRCSWCWLLAGIAALRERVDEHEWLLRRDSRNSSLPPSRDPPLTRQQRRSLARKRAKESLRKQGTQPGHEGKTHEMAAPERVDERRHLLPERCGCGHLFDGSEVRLKNIDASLGQSLERHRCVLAATDS